MLPFERENGAQLSLIGRAESWYRQELESYLEEGECGAWYGPEGERLCRDRAMRPVHVRGEVGWYCRTCGRDRTGDVRLGPLPPPLSPQQRGLFDAEEQIPLPFPSFHAPEGQRVSPECLRGFHGASCAHHRPDDLRKGVKAETCGRQRCDSSWRTNAVERARDSHNGTTDRDGRAAVDERLALRHFGSVPWAVAVWTLPEELRSLCWGDRLRAFRKAAGEMTVEVARALVSDAHSEWYLQSWLHPCGEPRPPPLTSDEAEDLPVEDELHFAPHENVVLPLACLDGAGRSRRARKLLPREWLGGHGWISDRWRERLVEIFGHWWPAEVRAPAVVFHWQFREDARGKAFALKYFGRPFPRWSHHPLVPARPRSLGLKHAKRRERLRSLVEQLQERPLPEWGSCVPCVESGKQAEMVFAAGETADECQRELERRLDAHSCEGCGAAAAGPYLEHRRIMNSPGMPGATVAMACPPSTAPPGVAPAWNDGNGRGAVSLGPGATGGALPVPPPAEPFAVRELWAFVGKTAAPLDRGLYFDAEARRYLHAPALSDSRDYVRLSEVEAARLERRRLRARDRAAREATLNVADVPLSH